MLLLNDVLDSDNEDRNISIRQVIRLFGTFYVQNTTDATAEALD